MPRRIAATLGPYTGPRPETRRSNAEPARENAELTRTGTGRRAALVDPHPRTGHAGSWCSCKDGGCQGR